MDLSPPSWRNPAARPKSSAWANYRLIAFARKHRARTPEPLVDAMFAAISRPSADTAVAADTELGVAMTATDSLLKLEHRIEIESHVVDLITEMPHTETGQETKKTQVRPMQITICVNQIPRAFPVIL